MAQTGSSGLFKVGGLLMRNGATFTTGAGAPTSGTSGTGAGKAGPGSLYIDVTNKALYQNTNTKASPTWNAIGGSAAVTREDIGLRVINKTGSTIAVDKLVALSGLDVTSGLPKIVLADADVAAHDDVWVTTAAILNNAEGTVAAGALSAANLNTNSISSAGDPVYLDVTAGAFAVAAPTGATARVMPVGFAIVKSATVGQILWSIGPGRAIGTNELQDGAVTAAKLDGGIIASTIDGVTITATGAGSSAEVPKLASVTGGTVAASKILVADAQKAVDTLRATTDLNVGGTGVPGAAAVQTEKTKQVTGLADTVATAVLTVTVPNAQHAAVIDLDVVGILGAGGAIGAGEATRNSRYQIVLARTVGVACVATASAAIGGAASTVAGGDAITSVVVTLSAMTGAVGATQTFDILVAITRSGAGATNHVALVAARIVNQNATGVTVA